MMPVILDLETSGLDFNKCGIWQIGAIDLNNNEEYLDESRIDDGDIVEKEALNVIGKTEEELRSKEKQSQKEMLEKFLKWVEKRKMKNFVCQNPQFDLAFLESKSKKYNLNKSFHYRAFDLHSMAGLKYFQIKKEFLIKKDHSDMNLTKILDFCGNIKDNRVKINKDSGDIVKEGKPHNALEDSKLTGECFSRIVLGKKMFPEYSQYKIPEYLEK